MVRIVDSLIILDGEEITVAILGPGTVVGTETLMQGVKSIVTITTSADRSSTKITSLFFITASLYLEHNFFYKKKKRRDLQVVTALYGIGDEIT